MEKYKEQLENAKRIAVVRTDKLGDMVLTLPVLRVIKEVAQSAKIDVIASSYTEVLLKNQEFINEYYLVDLIKGGIDEVFKKNRYDVVFFPRPRLDEIWASFRHRIPLRVGSGYRWYSCLLNHKVFEHRKTAEKNEAQYNVDLVNNISGRNYKAKLLRPYIPENKCIAEKLELIDSYKEIIIIHPGGGGSAPKWDAEKFGKLADLLIKTGKYEVIITGTKEECSYAHTVQKYADKARNMCGKLSLEELMAVIDKSKCLIANSTGVLHIAAAIGINVIGFYPNTPSMSSKRWGALTDKAVFLSPELSEIEGENDDLNRISVETAFKKFEELMRNHRKENNKSNANSI